MLLQELEERSPVVMFDQAVVWLAARGVAGRSRRRVAELLRQAIAEEVCVCDERLAFQPEADQPHAVTLVRLNHRHPLVAALSG